MYNLKHSPFVMSYCTASGRKEGGTESPLKTPYFFTLPISEYLRLFSFFKNILCSILSVETPAAFWLFPFFINLLHSFFGQKRRG